MRAQTYIYLFIATMLLAISPSILSDSKHYKVELSGLDGGTVTGYFVPNKFEIGTLKGDMDLRLGTEWLGLGESMQLKHLSIIPWEGFGSCYIHSGNWSKMENRFPDIEMDLVGEKLDGYSIAITTPNFPDIYSGTDTGNMGGCLVLFEWGPDGTIFPVDSPFDADGFFLWTTRWFSKLPTYTQWWAAQVGEWYIE